MFKKITTLLASTLLLSTVMANSANAATITQELLFIEDGETVAEIVGSVTISISSLDEFGESTSWLDFSLFGMDILTEAEADATDPLLFGEFIAIADVTNPFAGLEFLLFDVTDFATHLIAFDGLVDAVFDDHQFSRFDDSNLTVFGELFFGDVTVVPEPGMIAIMSLGLGFMVLRRRKIK